MVLFRGYFIIAVKTLKQWSPECPCITEKCCCLTWPAFCSTVKNRSLYNIMFFFHLQPDFHSMLEFHRLCSPGSFLLTLLHTPLWSCLRVLAVIFTSAVYPVSVPACMWQIKFVNWNHFKIGEMGNWVTKSKLTAAAGIEKMGKIGSPESWFAFRWWI